MATTTTRRAPVRKRAQAKPQLPMLRNSERGTLKQCEFQWDVSYNRRMKGVSMPALRFGALIHGALAAWYVPGVKRGEHPATAFERLYTAELKTASKMGFKDEDGRWSEAGELGVLMMNNYVETYGKDDEWQVLVTEYPFEVVVNHPTTGEPWFVYVGVMDGVWRHLRTKKLWVPDHKTTSGIGDSKLNYLQMDDQAGSYWGWGVDALILEGFLKKNQKLQGMLYNFMRKAKPDERHYRLHQGKKIFLNLDGTDSKKQPSPYFLRQPIYRDEHDRAMAKHRSMVDYRRIELIRAGELEQSKTPGMFTCPGCPVSDVCELHETGHDYESMIKSTMKPWDPYAEHEIYAGR